MPASQEIRSLITADGQLRLSLESVDLPAPGPNELIVRVEATPINPSDLGLLLGPADTESLRAAGTAEAPVLLADVPERALASVATRVGQSLSVGNEGAGTVIEAGAAVAHLKGRKVAMLGGGMYAQLRRIDARACIVLPEDASAEEGASLFVNPLTALAFTEVMRAEGHTAIVHTAAASNLGQMLVRICQADNIPLVNIVRSAEQVAILKELGAEHVVDSSAPGFEAALTDAIATTGATIGFDAIGGGKMAGKILKAMEDVAARALTAYSRYGSDSAKQVYIYGTLDMGPTLINRSFGFSWDVGGFLLTSFLKKAAPEVGQRMRARVAAEYRTTFASRYTATIGLGEALDPAIAAAYIRKGTGAKYLIDPSR